MPEEETAVRINYTLS